MEVSQQGLPEPFPEVPPADPQILTVNAAAGQAVVTFSRTVDNYENRSIKIAGQDAFYVSSAGPELVLFTLATVLPGDAWEVVTPELITFLPPGTLGPPFTGIVGGVVEEAPSFMVNTVPPTDAIPAPAEKPEAFFHRRRKPRAPPQIP